ncbi:histidinol dehydrogenase [Brochothrix thermosphacta]|uniref:Histidinol dehydrogenase n=1 Tax=Brochothrix thermosphacta TaxID=2756 RepID=A0A2X0QJT1_BROTH|nr:histidinol dehydrogenase [Brochothrix thermosphacta]ODJ59424.1 histidinol dehydrogenase [Brochothrix thermosphacta]ODJ60070.1 histidinol dehydrogenase [Brochothrix thermosphacta]SPP28816.1 histidinol dehydrogenase [Brochothrix thermosphacta]
MKIEKMTVDAVRNLLSEWDQGEATSHQAIETQVSEMLQKIKIEGDTAIRSYTETYDHVTLADFRVSEAEIDAAYQSVEPAFIEAMTHAKRNITSYHEQQKRHNYMDANEPGIIRGQLIRPIAAVGVYVPGGTAAYPSSVLMNVLPAKIAGVPRITMVTPPSETGVNPYILAAAKIAGVTEVYQVGGVQAIAALAYGTESITAVDKIVGPGNVYVATAKKQVFGQVGIDMIAGPSEVVVVADAFANPRFIAADLLSQAEHDQRSRAILVTPSLQQATAVAAEVEKQLRDLPREAIAREAIATYGTAIVVNSLAEAFEVVNVIAPEHLEVQVTDAMSHLAAIHNAGSIFLGAYASEPLGDYLAGPNHVLPTSGTARFFSGLNVDDFCKKSSFISYTKDALKRDMNDVIYLAEKEGLDAHARAIKIRFEEE